MSNKRKAHRHHINRRKVDALQHVTVRLPRDLTFGELLALHNHIS